MSAEISAQSLREAYRNEFRSKWMACCQVAEIVSLLVSPSLTTMHTSLVPRFLISVRRGY
jgi:hypothetical protein